MEFVNGKKLYHIQRNKRWGEEDSWSVGTELVVGEKHNKFLESRYTSDYTYIPYDREFLSAKMNTKMSEEEINYIIGVWGEYVIKTREYIFELERVNINPKLPSRFKCLFLTDKEHIEFWKHQLGLSNEHSFYELSVTGVIHKANQKFLETDTKSQKHYHELARKYWNGDEANEEGYEYLFEGSATVTRIL